MRLGALIVLLLKVAPEGDGLGGGLFECSDFYFFNKIEQNKLVMDAKLNSKIHYKRRFFFVKCTEVRFWLQSLKKVLL
jgi:hypothetical protein